MASTNFNLDSLNLVTGNGADYPFTTSGGPPPPQPLGTFNAYHGSDSASLFYNILSVDINLCTLTDDYYLEYNACPNPYTDWVFVAAPSGAYAEVTTLDFVSKYTLQHNLSNSGNVPLSNSLAIEYAYEPFYVAESGSNTQAELTLYCEYATDDIHWNNVVLALRGENFVDISDYGHSLTVTGNVTSVDTEGRVEGGNSLYFDGVGDYLTSPIGTEFHLTGDFTLEAWIRRDSSSNTNPHVITITDTSGNNEIRLQILQNGTLNGLIYHTGSYLVNISSASGLVSVSTWNHVAFVRHLNTHTIYLNGQAVASAVLAHTVPAANWRAVIGFVGYAPAGNNYVFKGRIDDVRITNGSSRYNTNFYPPDNILEFIPNCFPDNLNTNIDLCSVYLPSEGSYSLIIDYDPTCVKTYVYDGYNGAVSSAELEVIPQLNVDIGICGADYNPPIGYQEFNYRLDYKLVCDINEIWEAYHGAEAIVTMQFPLPFPIAVGFHGATFEDQDILQIFVHLDSDGWHGCETESDLTLNPAKTFTLYPAEHGAVGDAVLSTTFAIFPRGYHGAEGIEDDILSIYPWQELPSNGYHGAYADSDINTTLSLGEINGYSGSIGESDIAPEYALDADAYAGAEGESDLEYAERPNFDADAYHGAVGELDTNFGIFTYAILKPFPIQHGYALTDAASTFEFCEISCEELDPQYGDNIIRSNYEYFNFVDEDSRDLNVDDINFYFSNDTLWTENWWWRECVCQPVAKVMEVDLYCAKRFQARAYAGSSFTTDAGETRFSNRLLALLVGTPDTYLYGEETIDVENPPYWTNIASTYAIHGSFIKEIRNLDPVDYIRFCPGYIIPNGNNVTFDFESPLIFNCEGYFVYHGATMQAFFAPEVNLVADGYHGAYAYSDLTIEEPWRAYGYHGAYADAKLSISIDFKLDAIPKGNYSSSAFYEEPILFYHGASSQLNTIKLPGPALFWTTSEGACFQNNYMPLTADGDIDYAALENDIYHAIYPNPAIVEFKPCESLPLEAYCVLGINYDYYDD